MNNILAQKFRIIPSVGPGTPQPQNIAIEGRLVGIETLGDLINVLMKFLVPFAAIILFFVLVWGGYDYLMSQGSPEKIKSGQEKITAGLIGFALLLSTYVIVRVISSIFGLGEGLF